MSTIYRTLGCTDIEVSTISMGCWAIVGGSTWGPQDEKDALEAMRAALDQGVTFFDTAEGYGGGYSEQLLAKGLADCRERVVIGSKVSPSHVNSYEELKASCDESLKNLGTDYIDVYHLHWPNRKTPIADILGWFETLRKAGKIRAAAVSNFGPGDLQDLLDAGRCEVNQLPYNLLWRAIEAEIMPLCREHDISVTCYSPIAQGMLTGKFDSPDEVPDGRARTRHFSSDRPQTRHGEPGCERLTFESIARIREIADGLGRPMAEVALAWLIAQPGVASVIAGARNAEQMTQNAQAMQTPLPADAIQALDAATRDLKRELGSDPDMWQSTSRYR